MIVDGAVDFGGAADGLTTGGDGLVTDCDGLVTGGDDLVTDCDGLVTGSDVFATGAVTCFLGSTGSTCQRWGLAIKKENERIRKSIQCADLLFFPM